MITVDDEGLRNHDRIEGHRTYRSINPHWDEMPVEETEKKTRVTPARAVALLAISFAADIALPSTLGTVPGPGCINCTFGPFVSRAWPLTPQGHQSVPHFYLGESCFDLFCLALCRLVAFAMLCGLLVPRARPAVAPLLQPLHVQDEVPPDVHEPGPSEKNGTSNRARLSPRAHRYLGRALAAIALIYSSVKGFARLVQSGYGHGVGYGLLYRHGTTPPELEFWICVVGSAVIAEIECRLHDRLVAGADFGRFGSDSKEAGGSAAGSTKGKKGAKSAADEAADAANEVKIEYCKRTDPPKEEVKSMHYCMRLMSRDVHLLALAYTSLIIAAAGESAVPYLYGKVIDAIAINPDVDAFRRYMLLLLLTALITGIFTGLRGSTFIVIGGRFCQRLRQNLFEALLEQELDFFGATKTGDVTSRLSADCQKVGDQVTLNVNVFLRSVIQVFFTLGFMVVINWRLALTCFVVVPAIVWASKVFGEYYRVLSTETQDALAEANSTAEEVISSMSTTRAFAAEKEESHRYGEGMSKYLSCVVRQARLYFFYSSATFTFLPYCTYCLVLFYGAQLINTPEGCSSGSASPPPPLPPGYPPNCTLPPSPPAPSCELDGPGLVSFVFYMQSLFSAFQSLGSIYTALAAAVGAADKVCKWIARKSALPPPAVPITPAGCEGELRLVDVSFRYALRPESLVLRRLSLHARPGEVVALCGPSGGGKSSVISLIERFYAPESGDVLLDGIPIHQLSREWFHRQVALVGQEPVLYARSLADNICYGLDAEARPDHDAVVKAARLGNAHDFIMGFEHGYDTFIGERGTQLSGGQKQRVAIARALVRQPKVLLLDEATSALDAESESVVQAAIDSMIAQGGMTVLVIAHRLVRPPPSGTQTPDLQTDPSSPRPDTRDPNPTEPLGWIPAHDGWPCWLVPHCCTPSADGS